VLFSEPKIPQNQKDARCARVETDFSALQRAENSSKVANGDNPRYRIDFSALQRAENSSNVSERRRG